MMHNKIKKQTDDFYRLKRTSVLMAGNSGIRKDSLSTDNKPNQHRDRNNSRCPCLEEELVECRLVEEEAVDNLAEEGSLVGKLVEVVEEDTVKVC